MEPDRSARQTREIGIRELKNGLCKVLAGLPDDGRILITRHGRPVALLIALDEGYDYVLAFAEEFARARLAAYEAYRSGEAVELELRAD